MTEQQPHDVMYSPMLTGAKFGKQAPKSRRWIIFGLLAACFYAGFNYVGGSNDGNAIPGRVNISFVCLLGGLFIEAYQRISARRAIVK